MHSLGDFCSSRSVHAHAHKHTVHDVCLSGYLYVCLLDKCSTVALRCGMRASRGISFTSLYDGEESEWESRVKRYYVVRPVKRPAPTNARNWMPETARQNSNIAEWPFNDQTPITLFIGEWGEGRDRFSCSRWRLLLKRTANTAKAWSNEDFVLTLALSLARSLALSLFLYGFLFILARLRGSFTLLLNQFPWHC